MGSWVTNPRRLNGLLALIRKEQVELVAVDRYGIPDVQP